MKNVLGEHLTTTGNSIPNPFLHIQDYPVSENTRRAYSQGWLRWEHYCRICKTKIFPAQVQNVSAFLTETAQTVSLSTLRLFLSAINKVHIENGHPSLSNDFRIKNIMRALARSSKRRPRKVKALLSSDLEAILQMRPATIIGMRDAAILAIGFAAALRRSEICNLKMEDIEFLQPDRDKMLLSVKYSKTDQAAVGYKIAIINGDRIRPLEHLRHWLQASQIRQGFLFRSLKKGGGLKDTPLSHSDISRLIKHYVAKINLDAKEYAGHSLRSGFITSAVMHRARLDKIMEVSRHKNTDMVMCYVRNINVFQDHAGQDFL